MKIHHFTSILRPAFTLLALIGAGVGIFREERWDGLFSIPETILLQALGLALGVRIVESLRWASIATQLRFRFGYRRHLSWSFASRFSSAFLWGNLTGDTLRAIWLSIPLAGVEPQEHSTARRWRADQTIVWERLLEGAALTCLLVPTVLGIQGTETLSVWPFPDTRFFPLAILGFAGLAFYALSKTQTQIGIVAQHRLAQAAQVLQQSKTYPGRQSAYFVITLVGSLLKAQIIWLLGTGLPFEVGGWTAVNLYLASALSRLLPISLNGAGLRELVFAAYFAAHGGDPVDGLLLGLAVTGVETLVALTGTVSFYRIINSFRTLSAPTN